MKIIGHRGARGTELENSHASIQAAFELDLDAIELDIHRTKDNVLVVMHDATTERTADQNVRITDVTFAELQHLRLKNGQSIPTLESVLEATGKRSLYIDIKDSGTVPLLFQIVERYPAPDITVVSRLRGELEAIRSLHPQTPAYMYFLKAEHPIPRPVHMVRVCKRVGLTGIAFDKLVINPLSYHLAKQSGLHMYIYSVKSLWGARLLHRLYPLADIATARPDRVNHKTL